MSLPNDIQVRRASVRDLEALVPLFDVYRQFYGQPADIPLARAFLSERFEHDESVIFVATDSTGSAVGFTQLYPSVSSVSAARIFILNDLFVAPVPSDCRCPRPWTMSRHRRCTLPRIGFAMPRFTRTTYRCSE